MKASFKKYTLYFKQPAGTSRGVLKTKDSWFIFLNKGNKTGVGECSIIKGLSPDDSPGLEQQIEKVVNQLNEGTTPEEIDLSRFPSIRFGLEAALIDLTQPQAGILFPSEFTKGKKSIPINGLIWMGDHWFMQKQINEKLKEGYTCIKLKIGAIDFEREIKLLRGIRKNFTKSSIELRVDANGAFHPDNALDKLSRLAELDIHSIEQPIKAGQWEEMSKLCDKTPLPIALDEELIGVENELDRFNLLQTIQPQYIILKPSLVGGFKDSENWIELAEKQNIGWWVTSALESNVGLNAIAQWTFTLNNPLPQGLGTGKLFTNNIDSPLEIDRGMLQYNPAKELKTENGGSYE